MNFAPKNQGDSDFHYDWNHFKKQLINLCFKFI
jgi:hypothetical protein